MKNLINKGRRRLGIPGRPALILNPNESASIDGNQLKAMQKNKTVARWLDAGILVVTDNNTNHEPVEKVQLQPKRTPALKRHPRKDDRKVQHLPKGLTGDGIEYHHLGGGWYQLFINGFQVTDRNVRKAEAETIAGEYE